MEIQNTKDYDKFDCITGNRPINSNKVKKIIDDIDKGLNMLPYCPIIVKSNGDKYHIIDGQHRFSVSKITEQPVYFLVCNDLTLHQIALLNSRGDKWKITDFLNCYISIGIEDYKILKDVVSKHKVNIKNAIDLLMSNKIQGKSTDLFQEGGFKINFYKETIELLELVEELFGQYRFSNDRYLISAVQQIKNKGLCDFELLKQKIAMAPMMMDKQSDTKNYIYNIERVYNFKSQTRKTLI